MKNKTIFSKTKTICCEKHCFIYFRISFDRRQLDSHIFFAQSVVSWLKLMKKIQPHTDI